MLRYIHLNTVYVQLSWPSHVAISTKMVFDDHSFISWLFDKYSFNTCRSIHQYKHWT